MSNRIHGLSFARAKRMKFQYGLLGLLLVLVARPALAQSGSVKHVVVVIDENTNFADAYNSGNMPYMTNMIDTRGALGTLYYANTHPSIGNYFELTTGQILTNDDSKLPSTFPVSVDNVVRELLAAGLTWKGYCESIPSVGYTGGDTGEYAVHHCILPYLTDVQNDSTQVKNLVPFTQFATDLNNNQLPSFSFVVPNMCDDAHDCSLSQADQWLQTNIGPLFDSPTFYQDTLLIFVWDESGSDNTYGGGNIEWAVFGAGVKQGYKQSTTTVYQHQSTLRLVLEKLGVSVFPGAAASAPDMNEFFTTTGSVPQITSAGTTTGTVGTALRYQITATNSPTSFNATGLPAGLTVNTASGLISGTPTAAGTSNVSLSATNASGTGTAALTLTINSAPAAPVITSASSATGTVNTAFRYQITATNGPTSFNATGLPPGLSVNTSSGLISGTPTAAGTSNVTLSATNTGGTGTAALTLTINNTVSSSGPIAYVQGASSANDGSATTASTGFPGNTGAGDLIVVAVSWDTSGSAQAGVSDSQGNKYVLATTSNNTTTFQALAIYYAANIKGGADTVTVTLNPSAGYRRLEIQEYSGVATTNPVDVTAQNINLNGGTNTDGVTSTNATTTADGDLIFGVATQDSGTDTLSAGTGFTHREAVNNGSDNPMLTEDLTQSAAGSVAATFTLSAAGSYQAQMVAFKPAGTVAAPAAPVINSSNTATGTVGTAFKYQITATNGPTSFNATGLPPGLSVNTSSGLISGTPTAAGTSNVTLSATNTGGTGTAALTLTINNTVSSSGPIAYVQGASSANDGSATTASTAFPGNTGAGDLIVVAVSWDTSGSAQAGVSDSQGNKYVLATTSNNTTTFQALAIYYAANIKGGADTVTVTLNPSAGYRRLEIQEYSGVATTNPVDVTAQNINLNGGTNTDGVTSTNATTTADGDLIFGVATQDSGTDTISAGTGFTHREAVNNGSDNPMLTEDLTQSAAGSVAATFTLSAAGSYQAQMVAFKAAGAP